MTNSAQRGLRRDEAAKFLKDNIGRFAPVASTLSRMASDGTGPRFYKFGRYPVYMPDDLLEWARGRIKPSTTKSADTNIEDCR